MFLSLVSGSSGNCTLLSHKNTTILVDLGMSCKKLEQALAQVNMTMGDIDAILVTHEHSDHIKGIGTASKRYGTPVYATLKTHEAMTDLALSENAIRYITPGIDFEIGSIGIKPFSIPHDAQGPVAYNFFFDDKKLSLATDIGEMTEDVLSHIKGSLAVLLESNHDINMLKNGPYPAFLKQRILGKYGHLSNEAAAKTALELAKSGTKHLMLGHLSDKNNTPRAAFYETAQLLTDSGAVLQKDIALTVASRFEVTRFR